MTDENARVLGGRYRLSAELVTDVDETSHVTAWRGEDVVLGRVVRIDIHRRGDAAELADSAPGSRRTDSAGSAPTSLRTEFLRHARAASQLDHPVFARILDVADTDEAAYVVTAWPAGTPLSSLLREGPLSSGASASTVAKIAEGVAEAHRKGVAVGRLRPDHVVVAADGAVTLTQVGTAAATEASDIQGIGALLYACLTARWPLADGAAGLAPAPHTAGRLCTPRQVRAAVPTDLSTVTMRALQDQSQPTAIHTAGALVQLLSERARTGGAVMADDLLPFDDSEPADPPPATRRRRRGATVAAAALGVVSLALIAVLAISAFNLLPGPDDENNAAPVNLNNSQPKDNPDQKPTKTSSEQANNPPPGGTTPIDPAAATGYDPFYQPPGEENPDEIPLTTDGDDSTAWYTLNYFSAPTFGNLKAGSGVIYDMGKNVTVHEVTVVTPTPGIAFDVLAGDTPSQDPSDFQKVAGTTNADGTTKLAIPDNTSARYWVLWITSLANAGGDNYNAGIGEVTLLQ